MKKSQMLLASIALSMGIIMGMGWMPSSNVNSVNILPEISASERVDCFGIMMRRVDCPMIYPPAA